MATEPTEQVGTRVMFENDRVRVWDLALAPGESLEKHIHRLDYFFIVESGGLIRFSDPDNPDDYHMISSSRTTRSPSARSVPARSTTA